CGVAVVTQQHIHDLAVLVDGAVQVPLVLAAEEEHLVGVPGATKRQTMLARLSSQLRPECLDPAQHGAVRHVDAALGQQLHHAGGRQWVTQGPTHGHQNHVGWPAVAREGGGGPIYFSSPSPSTVAMTMSATPVR